MMNGIEETRKDDTMPYNDKPLTLFEVQAVTDFLGCYSEIDGDRMYVQFFCSVTGDHLGTAKLR